MVILVETEIWSPSENLTERIKKQRAYYWLDEKRPHNNNLITFTTGVPNDLIEFYGRLLTDPVKEGPSNMGKALTAMAETLNLPEGFWERPLIVRRALIFAQTLRQIPVEILPDELVVGFKFSTGMSAGLNEKEIEEVAKLRRPILELTAKYFGSLSSAAASQGHLIADHQTVIEKGFKVLRCEAEGNMKKATSPTRKAFYEAVIICCDAVREFQLRYAKEARDMAAKEKDPQRKKELLQIADNCDWVPWNSPRTFWEALQSLWFQHMLIMLAENYPGPGTSFGRIDQYLIPYYQKDIEGGRITREAAKELIQSFMVKPNYAYDYSPYMSRYGRHAGDGQLWTVGGKGIGERDLTNDLTYLFIEAFYELNILEPKANVRIHSGTPKNLLDYVADITRKTQGAPFILNFDKSVIESLENQGLTHEEAVEYAPIGCLENTIRGSKAGTVDCHFNLAKAVELVFTRGRDYLHGGGIAEAVGMGVREQELGKCTVEIGAKEYSAGDLLTFDSGDPSTFKTFDEFLEAYKSQLKATLDLIIELQKTNNRMLGDYQPCPYLSMFITGCMEDGKDVHEGGGRYNPTTINGVGIGTVADSLAAIKKFVFEDKKVSMEELAAALFANWKGYEELRMLLWNKAPKFGNDDDYVDLVARNVSQWWQEYVNRHTAPNGRRFRAGYLSWNQFIQYGTTMMATPDGRKRGVHLSGGIGPVQGQDKNGPTAAIKSVTKLGLETCPSGASYTWTLNPATVRKEEGLQKLGGVIMAYESLGGQAWQTNCISVDTLKDAQKHPENYGNLLVRITGYNAYFVTVGRALQDEVIARTEHQC